MITGKELIKILIENRADNYGFVSSQGGTLYNWKGRLTTVCVNHDRQEVILGFSGYSREAEEDIEADGEDWEENIQVFTKSGDLIIEN